MAQKTRRSHGVAVSTLFSAISLLYGTAAYGGYYPGHIDPGGNGSDIPGFTSDLVFSIDPGCIVGEGSGWRSTSANTGSAGNCGNASVLSATIYLYSYATGDHPTGPVLDQFTLANKPVIGVYSVNGALEGIDTDPMGPRHGSSVYIHSSFWLQLVSGFCIDGCRLPGGFGSFSGVDPGYLSAVDINHFGPPGNITFGPACIDPNNCSAAAAPEPGTLGLILGALGGGWLARRRKAKLAA